MRSPTAPASRSPPCPASSGASGPSPRRRASGSSARSRSSGTRPAGRAARSPRSATARWGSCSPISPAPTTPRSSSASRQEMVAAGQSLFILGTHGRENCAELVLDLMSRVDGLIIMGRTVSDEVVRALEGGRTPIALLARPPVDDIPSVRTESLAPAVALTEHLLEHGHTRLAFVGDPASSPDAEERWRGFAQALGEDAGEPFAAAFGEADGPPGGRPRARLGRHRSSVRQRRARARRLQRRPLTRAADPRGHRHHRVGRHPARAVRLPSPDHRAPADARARRRHREPAVRAHRGRASPWAPCWPAAWSSVRAAAVEPPSEEEEST